jgi:K+-sensing histidine kinase KdpD
MTAVREAWLRLRREGFAPGSPKAYLFALACVAGAACAHVAFAQFAPGITPSILYNPAVFIAALFGGVRAGLLAVGLSVVLLWWAFDWHSFDAQAAAFGAAVNCTLYVAAAMVIIWIAARYRSFALPAAERSHWDAAPSDRRRRLGRLMANPLAGYVGAAVCIGLATLIRAGFGKLGGEVLPLVSYYPAILLSALIGGTAAGLLALLLSLCVVWSDFPGPLLSFDQPSREESVSLALYVFVSLLTVWLAEGRRVEARAEQSPVLGWVTSMVVAASAVLLTTFLLLEISSYLAPEHLILGYLLPTVIVAMHYGSTVAVFTSFISGLAGAYFLFPPKFSFYIADRLNLVELGFFLLLAITASKAIASSSDGARDASPRRAG